MEVDSFLLRVAAQLIDWSCYLFVKSGRDTSSQAGKSHVVTSSCCWCGAATIFWGNIVLSNSLKSAICCTAKSFNLPQILNSITLEEKTIMISAFEVSSKNKHKFFLAIFFQFRNNCGEISLVWKLLAWRNMCVGKTYQEICIAKKHS